jgi:hypothetical protein
MEEELFEKDFVNLPLNRIGKIKKIKNFIWTQYIVEIINGGVLDKKGEIQDFKREQLKKLPIYLVRPHDFHIWEIDPENGCYRSYSTRDVTYPDGTRPNAQETHTYDILTKNHDFFPITSKELPIYEEKNHYYHGFISWQSRSDGHDGIKGGTEEEYKEYLERVKEYLSR